MFRYCVLVLGLLISTASYAEDSCAVWSFHGYRLGMTEEEALELRKIGFHYTKTGIDRVAKVRGKARVIVDFTTGTLDRFTLDFPEGFLALKGHERAQAIEAAMIERLGPPVGLDYRARNFASVDAVLGAVVLFQIDGHMWISEECGAIAFMTAVSSPSILGTQGDSSVTVVDLNAFRANKVKEIERLRAEGRRFLN